MKSHTKNLRFNHNPLNLILGTRKKQGLRIGYMEAALDGFYLNCMETGVHPEKLSKLLSDKFHCTDAISSCQLFLFLINEGDRASYSIMVPYLLSTENLNQFENTIRERFGIAILLIEHRPIHSTGQKSIQIQRVYRRKRRADCMD